MSRSFLAALALVTLATPVAAQMGTPPQSGRGLLAGITLTPAQQQKVDSTWKAHQPMRDKMQAQMQPGQRPDSAQMAVLRNMREQNMKDMRGILTPDQQKVFDQNLEQMRSRMGGPGAVMGPPPAAGAAPPAPAK